MATTYYLYCEGKVKIYEKASTKSKKVSNTKADSTVASSGITNEVKVSKDQKDKDLTDKFYIVSDGFIRVNDVYGDNMGSENSKNSNIFKSFIDPEDGSESKAIDDAYADGTKNRLVILNKHTFTANSTVFLYKSYSTSSNKSGYVGPGSVITSYDATMYKTSDMSVLAQVTGTVHNAEGTWYKVAEVSGTSSGTSKNKWLLVTSLVTDNGRIPVTQPDAGKSDLTTSPVNEEKTVEKYSEYISSKDYAKDLNDNGLTIQDLRGVFGMPNQFLPLTDPRGVYTEDNLLGNIPDFGNTYLEKIVNNIPLLLMTPGSPEFMSSYNSAQRSTMLATYIQKGIDAVTLEALVNEKTGKFYSLRYDYTGYFYYVNAMCRSAAYFLNIEDYVVDGEDRSLGTLNWLFRKYKDGTDVFGHKGLSRFLGTYAGAIPFYVEAETSISDSFSNSTTRPSIADQINGLSDQAREMNFLLGSVSSAVGGQLDNFVSSDGVSNNLQNVTDQIQSMLGSNNILSNLTNHVSTILSGGKMMFPEIWSDSSFSRDYSVKLKFVAQSGDPVSIYLDCLVPTFHCLGLVWPRQSASQAYYSPYLVRAFYKGIFNVDMGIITGMSLSKGQEGEWTKDGLPTVIEVTLDIKDLYDGIFMSKQEVAGDMSILSNITELDYIANMCGINYNEPDVRRTVDMYLSLGFVSNVKDKLEIGVWDGLTQWVNQRLQNIFGKF